MRTRGYTLIELLAALAIVALLAGFALPAFSGAMEATRAGSAEAALLASLGRAGSGAAISGSRTVLCPSLDGEACRRGADWSAGWLVFQDRDGDRERNPAEALLAREGALPGRVRLRSSVGRTRIVFQGNGSNAGSNVTFTLCDGRGPKHATALVLNNQGRLRRGTPDAQAVAATCAPN